MQYVLLVVLLALTWGFVLLPQQRRIKAHRLFVANLAVGDEVITTAGVFGTVVEVETDRVRLQVAPDVIVTLARPAIGRYQSDLPTINPTAE